jgi:sterol desaturase/sphingolipid hydroxylase (fatty acid hydroxylase superfamily)
MGLLTVFFFGIPVTYWAFYRICSIFFTYWTHANITLPVWLEKSLALVVVTPNMHKFHHHFERPWTDRNFGNIFFLWDRIFGTFIYENLKAIKFGLDTLDGRCDEDFSYQLGLPFNKNIKTDD